MEKERERERNVIGKGELRGKRKKETGITQDLEGKDNQRSYTEFDQEVCILLSVTIRTKLTSSTIAVIRSSCINEVKFYDNIRSQCPVNLIYVAIMILEQSYDTHRISISLEQLSTILVELIFANLATFYPFINL